jgi:hypothetical protein
MIWLTWRQFRTHGWVFLGALGVLAIALAATGPHLVTLFNESGIASCQTNNNCEVATSNFLSLISGGITAPLFYLGTGLLYVLPAVVGLFWGAPLVARELETGTYRLVWNQSVTRNRWLAAKLGLLGVAAMATAGLFSLMVTWWASPIDQANVDRITPLLFGARGVAPIGYAAFAFALGVTVGVLVRRTIPAMAVTLVIAVAALLVMPLWGRAHLIPPLTTTTPFDTSNIRGIGMSEGGQDMRVTADVNIPDAWIITNETVKADGNAFTGPGDLQKCGRNASPDTCIEWIASLHLQQKVTYQPDSRFWPLQFAETAIFLVLAGLLAGSCFWLVRPRRLA